MKTGEWKSVGRIAVDVFNPLISRSVLKIKSCYLEELELILILNSRGGFQASQVLWFKIFHIFSIFL